MNKMNKLNKMNKMPRKKNAFFIVFALPIVFILTFNSCATLKERKQIYKDAFQEAESIDAWFPVWTNFSPGIETGEGKIKKPKMKFYFVKVDLTNPEIKIVLNKPGAVFGTVLSTKVSSFAREYGTSVAINSCPFSPVSAREGETREITGLFIRDGRLWGKPDVRYDAVVFKKGGGADFVRQSYLLISKDYKDIENAVGGFLMILADSTVLDRVKNSGARHPRTVLGLSDEGSFLYILVIDGRQLSSSGATEEEAARLLLKLGAESGLNLDGGGSTTLVLTKNRRPFVVNSPVNKFFPGFERAVAVCIGVKAGNTEATNAPLP